MPGWLRNMLPSSAVNKVVDMLGADAKLLTDLRQRVVAFCVETSNLPNPISGQFRGDYMLTSFNFGWIYFTPLHLFGVSSCVMIIASRRVKSALTTGVDLVIMVSAKEQVFWVTARRSITFMANVHLAGIAFIYSVSQAVSSYHSFSDLNKAIAATIFNSQPRPAFIFRFFINACVKASQFFCGEPWNCDIFNCHFILRYRLIWLGLFRCLYYLSGPLHCSRLDTGRAV